MNRHPAAFLDTKGGPRSNSGGTSFWMKSKVASSHATRSWSIPTSIDRPSRRWHTTSRSLTIPPARSPEIGGSIHLKRRPSLRKQASSGLPFQPQASSPRYARGRCAYTAGGPRGEKGGRTADCFGPSGGLTPPSVFGRHSPAGGNVFDHRPPLMAAVGALVPHPSPPPLQIGAMLMRGDPR